MNTPIADFVNEYIKKDMSRFHMPGHKGESFLGCESFDITEIGGADVLSSADGIIRESEDNASELFGTAHSFYVTEGSTTAIYAMLSLVKKTNTEKPVIMAARNVHKAFIQACALLDLDIDFIMPERFDSILKCEITAEMLEEKILNSKKMPSAVYVTSPDYLGNIQDIGGLSKVCRKYGIPLLVDNAHGAYLRFLEKPQHPIDLGATVCCDSAHKTLPVLTGGAYLHISKNAPKGYIENARGCISLFSSTSPSYLIMQSLDLCNVYLEKKYKNKLSECIEKICFLKSFILEKGFSVLESEPLKIVIDALASGYSGFELADLLRDGQAEPEFFDNDFLVLMITPQNSEKDFERLKKIFSGLKIRKPLSRKEVSLSKPERAISVRDAVFKESETVSIKNAVGRICAEPTVSCPPAVPIAVSGEKITKEAVCLFEYYGIDEIRVVKKI